MVNLDLLVVSDEHRVYRSNSIKSKDGNSWKVDPEDFAVETQWGTNYKLKLGHKEVNLCSLPNERKVNYYEDYFADKNSIVGRIFSRSNKSGSIMLPKKGSYSNDNDECIGKYKVVGGQYEVAPYKRGSDTEFKQGKPLDFLLRVIHQNSLDHLYKTIYAVLQEVGPCSVKDLPKQTKLQDVPKVRLYGAFNLLSHRGFIRGISGYRVEASSGFDD